MKIFAFLLLATVATASAISALDGKTLVKGLFEGLATKEDIEKLTECADDSVVGDWKSMIAALKEIRYFGEHANALLGLSKAIKPAFSTIIMVIGCSTGDLPDLLEKFKKVVSDPDKFIKQVELNIDFVQVGLPEVISLWDAEDYEICAKVLGALMKYVFDG